MMQDHMRSMRQMPGMMAGGCANWQMMDPNMMGPGTMGHGMGWAMPPGVTPDAYQKQMSEHRQTMRGMGWMWAPDAAACLPDADSKGAQLESKYCSQCHAPPSPSIHTAKQWGEVTARMRAHIGDQAQTSATGVVVKVPSAAELDTILEYLGKHASAGK